MSRPSNFLPGQSDLRYGGSPAQTFLQFVGPIDGTVLDIGSGEGAWGPDLRRAGAERLIAIEPDHIAAEVARSRYDRVVPNTVEDTPSEVISQADIIILADCLEHLPDPWSTLTWLGDSVKAGCELFISLPNLRFLGLLGPVLVRGRFEYSDGGGLLDRGHLRWFTRSSLEHALHSSGWTPLSWSGESGTGARALANRLTGHFFAELLCHQLYMKAAKLPTIPARP